MWISEDCQVFSILQNLIMTRWGLPLFLICSFPPSFQKSEQKYESESKLLVLGQVYQPSYYQVALPPQFYQQPYLFQQQINPYYPYPYQQQYQPQQSYQFNPQIQQVPVYQPVQNPIDNPNMKPFYQPSIMKPVYQPAKNPAYQSAMKPVNPVYQPTMMPVYQPTMNPTTGICMD